MDVVSQVSGLQRAALLLESEPRALPGDSTAAVSDVGKQLVGVHVVLVVPESVEVGHAVGQQSCKTASEGVTLATSSLQTALTAADEGFLPIRDVVDGTLLDNGDTAEGIGQLSAQLVLLALVDVDVLALRQTAKLDDIGGQDAVLVSLDKVWASLSEVETIGVKDERHALLLSLRDYSRASLLHGWVASETGADDNDVQTVEHSNYVLGDAVNRLILADVFLLAHVRVHHQVGGVGLDNGARAWLANNVGLSDC